jgi:hypothetical protein
MALSTSVLNLDLQLEKLKRTQLLVKANAFKKSYQSRRQLICSKNFPLRSTKKLTTLNEEMTQLLARLKTLD